jgi:hypothetical protein
MKNNKTLRLAQRSAARLHPSSASGRTQPTKKPAAVSHPGVMRSFGEYAFLEDSRYVSQIIFCDMHACFRVPGAAQRECNGRSDHGRAGRADRNPRRR